MDAWYNEKKPNYLGSSFSGADVLTTLATNFTYSADFENTHCALDNVNSLVQYIAEIGTRLKTLEAK